MIPVTSNRCWRCSGTGQLGTLPGGAPLLCRLCYGTGRRTVGKLPLRDRLKQWWKGFVRRHLVADNPWEE